MQFDYFYEEEAEQYSFYRIPKAMFTDPQFTALSVESRVLYGLMLDRMSLSRKNQWVDEDSRVYIRFTVEDIMEQLNCGKAKAIKLMGELDEENGIGLIQKVRVGFGKPSIIYVKNFIARRIPSKHVMDNSEVQKSNFKKYENRTSRGTKIELHEVSKSNLKKYENRTSRSTKIEPQEVRKSNLMRYENRTLMIWIIFKRITAIMILSILLLTMDGRNGSAS